MSTQFKLQRDLAYVRRMLRLSLREASRMSGISHEQIRRLEAGIDRPRDTTKAAILEAYAELAEEHIRVYRNVVAACDRLAAEENAA